MAALAVLFTLWEKSKRRRNYLTRPALLPHSDSAWKTLYDSYDDKAYVNTMSLDVASFHRIHRYLVTDKFLTCSIRHNCTMTTYSILGLALLYLNSTMGQKSMCLIFGIPPAVCSRFLWRGLHALQKAFRADKIEEAKIEWPNENEMQRLGQKLVDSDHNFEGCFPFGFIDGLRLEIQDSGDLLEQNAYYSGKNAHACIGNVIIFCPEGTILWWKGNCPGSWHDISIAATFLGKCRDYMPKGCKIIADSGFIRKDLSECLLVSKTREAISQSQLSEKEKSLARSITSARQAAEWGMHAIKGTFGRLRTVLTSDHKRRCTILECCMHLHNYQTRTVELNQIRTVYAEPMQQYTID